MEQISKKKKVTILGIGLWELLSYFILYSIAGFFVETIFAIVRYGVFESRQSFVYGPFCSIYGLGAIIMIIFNESNSTTSQKIYGINIKKI